MNSFLSPSARSKPAVLADRPLRILLVHNYYQLPGGEDEVFHAETKLLASAGHHVSVYTRHNNEIRSYRLIEKAGLALRSVWAWDSLQQMRRLMKAERPDVVHFHNTFPLISPSAYSACKESGVPVVQTLHNPKLICPAATFHRDNQHCEDCSGKTFPWPGVLHGCYRDSHTQSGVVAAQMAIHKLLNIWKSHVDTYIAPNEFYAGKFVDAGFPREKIVIKPHFVGTDPGPSCGVQSYALFVGRLAAEKGVLTLLEAWKHLPSIPLQVRGEGPLLGNIQERASDPNFRITLVPRLSKVDLIALFHGARFLVWPSGGYYETFGLVAAEAFACSLPVIASGIGVQAQMVQHGKTGLHFTAGDSKDLAAKVHWAWTHPREMEAMGRAARMEYEAKYTAESNYHQLIDIYHRVIAEYASLHNPEIASGIPANENSISASRTAIRSVKSGASDG